MHVTKRTFWAHLWRFGRNNLLGLVDHGRRLSLVCQMVRHQLLAYVVAALKLIACGDGAVYARQLSVCDELHSFLLLGQRYPSPRSEVTTR